MVGTRGEADAARGVLGACFVGGAALVVETDGLSEGYVGMFVDLGEAVVLVGAQEQPPGLVRPVAEAQRTDRDRVVQVDRNPPLSMSLSTRAWRMPVVTERFGVRGWLTWPYQATMSWSSPWGPKAVSSE